MGTLLRDWGLLLTLISENDFPKVLDCLTVVSSKLLPKDFTEVFFTRIEREEIPNSRIMNGLIRRLHGVSG